MLCLEGTQLAGKVGDCVSCPAGGGHVWLWTAGPVLRLSLYIRTCGGQSEREVVFQCCPIGWTARGNSLGLLFEGAL